MDGTKRRKALQKPIYNFQNVGRITNNGYLNFLMEYKKTFCGVSPNDMVRFGAKQWNQLTLEEKELFKNMIEPVTVIKSAPQEFENQSYGENPGKSEREKRSPVRSPYASERESMNNQEIKKNPSPETLDQNRLGSAVAYIHFIRKFQRKNKDLAANDLLKKATRFWCRLRGSQREQFEKPLWIVRFG
ncbi:protamine-like protein 99C [Drosophila suzukii]|uniref:Protamine-like protein 99C n=1 Tax=Drosophila suzukii TaxID=28584 RepID=A0ABM4TUX2_DROSZ